MIEHAERTEHVHHYAEREHDCKVREDQKPNAFEHRASHKHRKALCKGRRTLRNIWQSRVFNAGSRRFTEERAVELRGLPRDRSPAERALHARATCLTERAGLVERSQQLIDALGESARKARAILG